jgi:glycosyl transferase family 25
MFNNSINIYVISLLRALDRRERIHTSLTKFNHTYTFFNAIDGSDKSLIQELKIKYNSTLADTHSACAISHIMVLEQFLKSNDKYIIILEDDAKILKKLPINIDEVENMFKDINIDNSENIDILYLHNRVKCNSFSLFNYSFGSYKITGGCGMEGYICTRIGASKIINVLNPLYLIDIQINESIKKNIISGYRSKYIYCKEEDNNMSYINGIRVNDIRVNNTSKKKILFIYIGLLISSIIGIIIYFYL